MPTLNIIVLNSGSNGNAVYVESNRTGKGMLLDCGISLRQIEQRLKVHGRSLYRGIPVLITHEHGDHVRGLNALCKSYHPKIYLTEPTYRHLYDRHSVKGHWFIGNQDSLSFEGFTIETFPKSHDAADPVGFVVEVDGVRFLYATDLGVAGEVLPSLLHEVDAALLESNYDIDMLVNGSYPEWLKNRVQSDVGHLSNVQTSELVAMLGNSRLRTLIYGHMSENNNSPEAVLQEWESLKARKPGFNPDFHLASRYNVGDVISV